MGSIISDYPLTSRFSNQTSFPEVIIMAEQTGGKHYSNTINFLRTNQYTIITYPINNVLGVQNWDRFDSNTKSLKLTNRANEMMDAIKSFITTNGII